MPGEKTIVENEPEIRVAMLGMSEGNGHPYSWSAILNSYDPEEMARSPFPNIARYLAKEPRESFGIPGAKVTHIWTECSRDAQHIARTTFIPHVVAKPEDVMGDVDAIIVATDQCSDRVERCRPFVERGLPIFVDKPLVNNPPDLRTFCAWVEGGARIMSSSCMRYAKEYAPYRASAHDLGDVRFASISTNKSWETYGIHALEGIYSIVGPGFISARNTGSRDRNIVHLKHRRGVDVVAVATQDMHGAFGVLTLGGTRDHAQTSASDFFHAFKAQLRDFISFVRTGNRPFPFAETAELMQMLLAGIRSREENGREVGLDEIATR